jgi:hypothetical protein
MSDPAKRLSEIEERIKRAEALNQTELVRLRQQAKDIAAEFDQKISGLSDSLRIAESELKSAHDEIARLREDAKLGAAFAEWLGKRAPPVSAGASGKAVEVGDVSYEIVLVDKPVEIEATDTTKCRGRLLKLMKDGFFDKPRIIAEIIDEFPRRGWPDEEKTIQNTVAQLFSESLFAKDRSGDRQAWKYSKPPNVIFKD